MMSSKWDYVFSKAVDWFFRQRSPIVLAMRGSLSLLVIILGVGSLSGVVKFQGYTVEILQGGSIGATVLNVVVWGSTSIFILSSLALLLQFALGLKTSSKKTVIVIEGRGLRDDNGNPLVEALGSEFPKNKIPFFLNLRQNLDGRILSPKELLPEIASVKRSLNQAKNEQERDNISVVYGGLTSVPFTFLTGVELDDEGEISVFDWDRTAEAWRQLDSDDDGKRLSTPDLQTLGETENVVLAISVSYPISDDDITTTFDYPIVKMELDGASSNSHWSASKQSALADQFLELSKELSAKGVNNIHLILAAPNSVVFQFGRRYDKRNLPNLIVYQYERSQSIKYPWGVSMPVGEVELARIEHSTGTSQ